MRNYLPVALLVLAGCTVGPDYKPPVVAGASARWVEAAGPGAVDTQWWQALGDATLSRLIEAALVNNADVRIAEARLAEARANRDATAGGRLPTLNATAGATETRLSQNGQFPINRIPGFNRQFGLFDAGFDAAWEIDIWGGTRRRIEAAGRRRDAAAARLAETRLQVIAEIGRSYGDLRAAQAREAILADDAGYRGALAALSRQRAAAGETSQQEASGAEARAASARAQLPGAAADKRAAIYRLAVLSGLPPEALLDPLAAPAALPAPPAIVAAGLRSELLERRPDVRAAAADLAAATSDIGVATADLFPKLTLIGSIGQQAQGLGDIASGGSTRFQFGPSLSWPILAAGRIRAQVRAADARADSAGAAYEKAVLTALADSETAINRYAAASAAAGASAEALARTDRSEQLAAERFRRGEDDRLALLEAQSARAAARLQASAAEAARFTAYLSLAKSLGGGWIAADKSAAN